MSITYTKYELKYLIDMNKEGKLVLPNFQREFVWDETKQKSMLSSFLVGLPIGGILNLSGVKGDFSSRRLCETKSYESPVIEREYLLDGQQRTSCLYSIFSDIFFDVSRFNEQFNEYFTRIRNRWFIDIEKIEEKDVFGFLNLKFQQDGLSFFEPDDVLPSLICKKIYKTKTDVWYHPKYVSKDVNGNILDGNRRENYIAEKACAEKLIPLYQIYENPDTGLHNRVLKKLAKQRMDDLEAAICNGEYSYNDILGHIDPDIQDRHGDGDKDAIDSAWHTLSAEWSTNVTNALRGILKCELPVIRLPKEEIGRAISVFSSINEGGMKLDLYDLIVARAAQQSDDKSLTERILDDIDNAIDISQALKNDISGFNVNSWSVKSFNVLEKEALSKTLKKHFLNALSIYVHKVKGEDVTIEHIKMKKILSLRAEEINANLSKVIKGLSRAYLFLHLKCGLAKLPELSYELMMLPIFNIVVDDAKWNDVNTIKRVEYWYWISLFGGRFRELQNQRCIEDLKSLEKWIYDSGNENPFASRQNTVLEDPGYSDFDCLAMKLEKSPPGAISAAILQYTLSNQPTDFLRQDKITTWDIASQTDLRSQEERAQNVNAIICNIDKHHILPLAGSLNHQESSDKLREDKSHILNSPLNFSVIIAKSNKKIGSKSFNEYKNSIIDTAKGGHFLPDFIDQQSFNDDSEYYEEFLRLRHEKIKVAISTELSRLI
jgi:hypothetical protein